MTVPFGGYGSTSWRDRTLAEIERLKEIVSRAEITNSGNPVLTEHLIDEPGQPTRQALDSVLDHFRTRLLAATGHNG